jgi:hypothetical protein
MLFDSKDATYAHVSFRFGNNQRFVSAQMFDDGNHNDGSAGDGVYGCKIEGCSNSVDYYLYADNESSGVFSPVRAAYEFYHMHFNISSGDLVINEVLADPGSLNDANGDGVFDSGDDEFVEVSGAGLEEGDAIIVGYLREP